MSDKSENNSEVDLLKITQESLNKRRDIELKYNFGLWVAVGALHLFLYNNDPHYNDWIWILVVYAMVFVLFTFLTLKFWHSNERDHKKMKHYRIKLSDDFKEEPRSIFDCLYAHTIWWHAVFTLFTLFLLLSSFQQITQKLISKMCVCPSFIDGRTGCLLIILVVIFIIFSGIAYFSKVNDCQCNKCKERRKKEEDEKTNKTSMT